MINLPQLTSENLIRASLVVDCLQLMLWEHFPIINLVMVVPLIILHFRLGGLAAWSTLFELVPYFNRLPVVTLAVCAYPKKS